MYSPDERRSIRSEMNRDAAPSPEEAKAEARRHLASEGCRECDEDDPDNLSVRYVRLPSCSAVQTPPDPTYVMCDDCYDEQPTMRERAFEKARKRNEQEFRDEKVVGVVFFECGAWEYVEAEVFTEDADGVIYADAHPHWTPTGPLRCRCGSSINEYVRLDEGADDE